MNHFMRELMSEVINYGGLAATREEVYADALAATGSQKAADMFAFGPRTKRLTPSEIAQRIPLREASE